jgi:hypothetical protein
VQVGRIPFHGELLYTIAPFGVLSGVGGGVGVGESLGKNRVGILLILFGVGGVMGGLFSHPSGGCVYEASLEEGGTVHRVK